MSSSGLTGAGFDLDAYFARIGYDGPREPTLEVLKRLHALHPAAIPFENIDVLLERGVDIGLPAIQAKLVSGKRGGYCFEHNGLFGAALDALGFQTEGLLARVLFRLPEGPSRPRTHKALRVTIDGEAWMADVGFGGCVLTTPLRIAPGAQSTPQEDFRLVFESDGEMTLQCLDGEWTNVYRLSPHPAADIDYELSNWFTSTHPKSVFRAVLMAARTTPQARYTLLQNRLTVRPKGGELRREDLDAQALAETLRRDFGLGVQDDWKPLLAKIAADGVP